MRSESETKIEDNCFSRVSGIPVLGSNPSAATSQSFIACISISRLNFLSLSKSSESFLLPWVTLGQFEFSEPFENPYIPGLSTEIDFFLTTEENGFVVIS